MDELLTLRQTAQRLNVPEATLRWWRHRGDGPKGFRAGRRVLYRASDVNGWVEEQIAAEEAKADGMSTKKGRPAGSGPAKTQPGGTVELILHEATDIGTHSVLNVDRHHPDDKKTVDLARDFKAERLAEYIERVVDAAPPLTQAQRDKLATLLGGAPR